MLMMSDIVRIRSKAWTLQTEARATRLRDLILTYGTPMGRWRIDPLVLMRNLDIVSGEALAKFLTILWKDGALPKINLIEDKLEICAAEWFLDTAPGSGKRGMNLILEEDRTQR